MIEERHRVKHATELLADEQSRLDLFLKITANATAYGSLARFDRRKEPGAVAVTVHGPANSGFPDRTRYPEDPGPYCFPPVAASITAGARLMLALIERTLHDQGGAYAFMDTDSIAIVATPTSSEVPCRTPAGDTVTALSHNQVRQLLSRFATLNPYGVDVINDDPTLGRSPWKVEHNSLRDPVWCYAIASKRYALYRPSPDGPQLVDLTDDHEETATDSDSAPDGGEDVLVDWSEHGLGLYLDPTDDQRRDQQARLWIRDAWQWLLNTALTSSSPLPSWADRYALTQFSVSTPRHAGWFRTPDSGGHTPGKPRPFGFGLLGHVDPFAPASSTVTPPLRTTGSQTTGTTCPGTTGAPANPSPPSTAPCWATNRSALLTPSRAARYRCAALGRSCRLTPTARNTRRSAPTGPRRDHLPAGNCDDGRSAPRPSCARTSARRATVSWNAPPARSPTPTTTATPTRTGTTIGGKLVLPVLLDIRDALGARHIAAHVGVTDRQVRNWLAGRDKPHAGASHNRQRTEQLSVDWARQQLEAAGKPTAVEPEALLYTYILRR